MASTDDVDGELLRQISFGAAKDVGRVDPDLLGDFLPSLAAAVASGRARRGVRSSAARRWISRLPVPA